METALRNTRPTARQMYLDPRTKIILCLTVSSITFAGSNVGIMRVVLPCLALIPLVSFIILKKPWLSLFYATMYVISITVPPLLMPYAPPAVNLFFTGMIAIFTKILPGMSMFSFLILTTTVSEFVSAMEGLHISKKFTIPVSVMFRFFPTIREEYAAIRDAMRLREVGSLQNPVRLLEYRMVPLLTGLLSIGNELSASALTRGLNAPVKRTNMCPVGFRVQDFLAFTFCACVIVLFILSVVIGL